MVSRHRSESPTPTEGPQPSKLGSTPWNSQPSKLGSTPWNAQPSKLGSTPWNSQPSKLGSTKYIQIHRATVELAPPGAGARALGRSGFNPTALALLRQLVGLKADLQTQLGLLPVVAHQQPSKLGSTPLGIHSRASSALHLGIHSRASSALHLGIHSRASSALRERPPRIPQSGTGSSRSPIPADAFDHAHSGISQDFIQSRRRKCALRIHGRRCRSRFPAPGKCRRSRSSCTAAGLPENRRSPHFAVGNPVAG
jgi:hypothetical protein